MAQLARGLSTGLLPRPRTRLTPPTGSLSCRESDVSLRALETVEPARLRTMLLPPSDVLGR